MSLIRKFLRKRVFTTFYFKRAWEEVFLAGVFVLVLSSLGFSQTERFSPDAQARKLVERVIERFEREKAGAISKYEYSYKITVKDEITGKIRDWTYELYCTENKSICQKVLIGKNGKRFSNPKIIKAREKASKLFLKTNENTAEYVFNYGLPLGYPGSGKNIWLDPYFYLRDCRILSSRRRTESGRDSLLVRLGDCNVDNENWKTYVKFMPKTEADIWLDEEDEGVIKMLVYARNEFSGAANQTKPLIEFENERTSNGLWLRVRARLETSNKLVFPTMKDDFQFDFFDYRLSKVNVDYPVEKSAKNK